MVVNVWAAGGMQRRGNYVRRTATIVLAALLTLLIAMPAMAKGKGKGRGKPTAAELQQRFKKKRGHILRKRVGLSDAKATAVETVLDKHSPLHQKLQRRLAAARLSLGKLLRADSNDQAAFAKALAELQTVAKAMQQLNEQELAQLQKVLTPKEQAKLLRALNRIRTKVRRQRMRQRGKKGKQGKRERYGERGKHAKRDKHKKRGGDKHAKKRRKKERERIAKRRRKHRQKRGRGELLSFNL